MQSYEKLESSKYNTVFRYYDEEYKKSTVFKRISSETCMWVDERDGSVSTRKTDKCNWCAELYFLGKAESMNCIPPILEYGEYQDDFFLLMEDLGKDVKDLFYVLSSRETPLDENTCKIVARQAVQYMVELKQKGILHGDIKLENFLYDEKTKKLYLIDFGAAMPYIENSYIRTFHGTPLCSPPERFSTGQCTMDALNVWSFGVLLADMLMSESVFVTEYDLRYKDPLLLENRYKFPHLSSQCFELVDKCLKKDPKERITLDQLAKDQWFLEETSL